MTKPPICPFPFCRPHSLADVDDGGKLMLCHAGACVPMLPVMLRAGCDVPIERLDGTSSIGRGSATGRSSLLRPATGWRAPAPAGALQLARSSASAG